MSGPRLDPQSDDPQIVTIEWFSTEQQAVSACEAYGNLFLDVTNATVRIGKVRWQAALRRIAAERIIYGNDYPWVTVSSVMRELEFFESLGLSAKERAGVFGDNLRALFLRVPAPTGE